jgi:hypothetical protein
VRTITTIHSIESSEYHELISDSLPSTNLSDFHAVLTTYSIQQVMSEGGSALVCALMKLPMYLTTGAYPLLLVAETKAIGYLLLKVDQWQW